MVRRTLSLLMSLHLIFIFTNLSLADDCEKAKVLIKEGNSQVSSNPSKAEVLYNEAISLCPKSAHTHYNLGIVRYGSGDFPNAVSSFKKAIELKPDFAEAMNGLVLSYTAQGINYEEAKELIEKALQFRPGDKTLSETQKIVDASRTPPYLTADLLIEDSNGNNILDAGEDVTLRVVVENKGRGAALAIKVDMTAPVFLQAVESGSIGNIMPGEKKEKIFNVKVPYTAKTGQYNVKVSAIEESGRYGAAPMEVEIPVKAPVPPKFAVSAKVDDDMAGHSSGNGNGVIEKGETIEIHLSITNEGIGTASDVVARLSPSVSGIDLPVAEVRFGSIPPQKMMEGDLVFAIPMTFKGDKLPTEIVIQEETGLFTARTSQNFTIADVGGKKTKVGTVLMSEDKPAPQAQFSFEMLISEHVVDIAAAVHKLKFTETEKRKDYYAVVIGIEKYRDIKNDAPYASHDARWVEEYFMKGMGVPKSNIRTLINEKATKGDIEKTVDWLKNKVKDKSATVLFYYSGHGAPDIKGGESEAYIVPYEGDPNYLETTAYPLKELYEGLSQLPTENVIVALDSCFAGTGDKSVVAGGVKPIFLEVKDPFTAKGNTVVLAAAQAKEVSSVYPEAGHGLFTYYFLKGLNGEADKNGDGWIELKELYDYIQPNVIETAGEMNREQHPVMSPDLERLGNRRGLKLTNTKK